MDTARKPRHTTRIHWMVDLADALGMVAAVLPYQEGCREASSDCARCWARTEVSIRGRQDGEAMRARFGGLTKTVAGQVRWTGEIRHFPAKLGEALGRTRPTVYFPASRSDVFHENAPEEAILGLIVLAAFRPDHRFVFPTKRWDRAAEVLLAPETPAKVIALAHRMAEGHPGAKTLAIDLHHRLRVGMGWPLPNFLVGASVGTQTIADKAHGAMRKLALAGWSTWASSEPRRSHIDWTGWDFLDWLVVGCESAPLARRRPMDTEWARDDRDWAAAAGVPFYLKQMMVDGVLVGRPLLDGQRHLGLPRHWLDRPAA